MRLIQSRYENSIKIEHTRGFTLIEILLIVAALAILSGATIIAINPTRQLAEARDNQRRVAVGTIWSALQQYALNNQGNLPVAIPSGTLSDCTTNAQSETYTICRTSSCSLKLTELTTNQKYIAEIPVDPSAATENYAGFNVIKDSEHSNRVVVCAPATELGDVIVLPTQ